MTTPAAVIGGKYVVGELLGRGGMAVVHRGLDVRLGRELAIKRLLPDRVHDQEFQLRFRREAKHAASLNHPAIVTVYDTGDEPGPTGEMLPYIVMELVDGRTLRQVLAAEGPLVSQQAVEITADICGALEFSHRHGIIHRDVKPSNVMLTKTGQVKVMDFGVARALDDSTTTHPSIVMGTALYMSPEQARGETVDARTDVYATGCLLYELLCGRPPFVGENPTSVADQHIGADVRPPSTSNGRVPPDLDAVVLKALAKNPVDRYQSAAEMRADLLRVAERPEPPAADAGHAVPPRGPDGVVDIRAGGRRILIGGLLTITCGLVAVALVASSGSPLAGGGARRTAGPTLSPADSRSPRVPVTPKASGTSTVVVAPTVLASSTAVAASTGTAAPAVDGSHAQSTAAGSAPNPAPTATRPIIDRYLINVVTDLCADLPGTGDGGGLDAPVIHYQCINSAPDNQKWDLVYRTTLGNDYYWIRNRSSGLCMDLPGFGAVPAGTDVSQYACGDNDNQHWYLVWRHRGYWIINRNTGLCLDVAGSPPAWPRLGYPLKIWYCSDFDDHEWVFSGS
jgi:serine/threonine protein kinase